MMWIHGMSKSIDQCSRLPQVCRADTGGATSCTHFFVPSEEHFNRMTMGWLTSEKLLPKRQTVKAYNVHVTTFARRRDMAKRNTTSDVGLSSLGFYPDKVLPILPVRGMREPRLPWSCSEDSKPCTQDRPPRFGRETERVHPYYNAQRSQPWDANQPKCKQMC